MRSVGMRMRARMASCLAPALFCASLHGAVVYTSAFSGSIQKAVNSLATVGGTVVVDRSITLASSVILVSNLTVTGTPNAVVTMTKPLDIFGFAGLRNVTIENVVMSGGHSGISAYNVDNLTIRKNTITGWSFRAIDLGAGMPRVVVEGNRLEAPAQNCVDGIFAQDTGVDLLIAGNILSTEGCSRDAHGIAVHTYGGSVTRPQVIGNVVTQGGGNFAVEVGQFGNGARVVGPVVQGNTLLMASPGNGGISVVGSDDSLIAGNTLDLAQMAPAIDAIEVGDGTGIVTGNTVRRGGSGARALALDSTTHVLVNGNRLNGYVFMNNSGTFGVTTLAANSLTENDIVIPGGSTWPYAIFIQCNVDGCDGSLNRVSYNRISGDTSQMSSPEAVHLEQDKGLIQGTVVEGNITGNFR